MPALLESLEAHPCFGGLDELRAAEYGRLDATGAVYLDYTGGGLYAESQVEEHVRMLRGGVYGNPHSANPTSSAATSFERFLATVDNHNSINGLGQFARAKGAATAYVPTSPSARAASATPVRARSRSRSRQSGLRSASRRG